MGGKYAVISDECMISFPQKKQRASILNQIRLLETLNGTKDELEKKGNGKLFYKHVLIVDMGSNGITRVSCARSFGVGVCSCIYSP